MRRHVSGDNFIRRAGRPSLSQAGQIRDQILDIAAELFLRDGYGTTSIEAVAKRAGISKRTFYHRFEDKADLFRAVVHRLVSRLRPPTVAPLFEGNTLEEVLLRLAKIIIHATLSPEALALHRLVTGEAVRFPELAQILEGEGSRQEGVKLLTSLLRERSNVKDPEFAAEQFLQLVPAVPQRRALGLGAPMTGPELDAWAEKSVRLFLNGCRE